MSFEMVTQVFIMNTENILLITKQMFIIIISSKGQVVSEKEINFVL